jgi:plastocyanin domain-containing protein
MMLMVNVAGAAVIVLIVWWFWLYKDAEAGQDTTGLVIVVENGTYKPSRINLTANQAIELHFLRKDASPCAEMLLFPALDISENLPLNKPSTIRLPPLTRGEYQFHCQMQMYRGVLKIE